MKPSSRRKRTFIVLNKMNDYDKIINFFISSWSSFEVSVKWKNWRDFRAQHSTQLRGANWSKIEILSLNSLARYQELQNEINCMNDSKDFQDTESVRSGQSHVTSQLVSFPPHPGTGGLVSRSLRMPSCKTGPPSIFWTHMVYRETFLQIQQRLLQHLIRRSWIHGVQIYQRTFAHHKQGRVKTKRQFKIRDASPTVSQKFIHPLWGRIFQIIVGQTNNDCRSQISISTHSPLQQHFLVGR